MEDRILQFIKESESPMEIEDVRYIDLFPEDDNAEPGSFDAILMKLMQDDPEGSVLEMLEKAQRLSEKKQR